MSRCFLQNRARAGAGAGGRYLRVLAVGLGFVLAGSAEAGELERYARPGPYPVGVRTLVFVDAARRDEYAGGDRTLVTEVWYPARDAARSRTPTTFEEFFGEHREAARLFVEHFGGELEEVNRRFKTVAVRGAALRRGRYPLLIFSHGNGGVRHQNVFQVDHLASHGYVVAAPDHTGNAGVTPLPDRALPYDRRGRMRSARERPLDVSFLITRLLAENERSGSWLRGSLDPGRVGVLGHSFGGLTACRVAESDSRVKAILPMTVAYGKEASIPMMLMLAGRDRTMKDAGNMVARLYYMACGGPKYLVTLRRAGHFSFTDMDHIQPAFGDGIGRDRKSGDEFLEVGYAKRVVNAYSLAFFDRYLRGDSKAGGFLTSSVDPEEVEVRHDSGTETGMGKGRGRG
jgi:predicted dienelactone hydrolase